MGNLDISYVDVGENFWWVKCAVVESVSADGFNGRHCSHW